MDIAFSFDDALLASASGDQTVHLTDVQTSKQKFVLSGHISSVKQVRFQPGNPNMLATSSRDGSVQLWDLRCRAVNAAIIVTTSALATTESEEKISVPHLGTYSSIPDAHLDQDNKRDIPGRRGEVSITALAFLGHGRENMILTGSEASTSVRLWDIRGRYSQRRGPPLPLSSTELPDAHSSHRHYGINSILLNTDESRFYALSRDNTIYAYSTSHLVLGNAPELSSSSSSRTSKYPSSGKTGLGPIYGFRHQSFHATSFYVKAALRKATPDKFELIAVGSSDGCPVLFPTDERFLDRPAPRDDDDNEELLSTPQSPFPQPSTRPGLKRMVSNSSLQTQRLNDTIPIYEIGTPLIRGHEREVTSLAWTRRGELVSLGDDYTARVWNEGPQARELRVGGEAEGKRWGCGWASTREGFDDE